jgi:hypothetical protein
LVSQRQAISGWKSGERFVGGLQLSVQLIAESGD